MTIMICIGRLYMGGIEKYAIDLAMGLKKKGHNVHMIVFYQVKNEAKRELLAENGIKVSELGLKSGRDIKLPYRFFKILNIVKPDVVHLNILPLLGVIPLIINPARIVYTVHQMDYVKILTNIYRYIVDGVIAVSQAVLSEYKNKGLFSESKYKVIYNGVSLSQLKNNFINGNNIELIMVSRLAQDKNPADAVEILKNLLNRPSMMSYNLTFIGEGDVDDEMYLASIRRRIEELGLTHQITFEGWKEDVGPYFRRAQGLLVLSDKESFGYSALEAMSYGVPVFSYHVEGGMHEFHKNEITGVVCAIRNTEEFAKLIDQIFSEPGRWEQLSANALETAKQFTVNQMVERTEDLYKSLLNKK